MRAVKHRSFAFSVFLSAFFLTACSGDKPVPIDYSVNGVAVKGPLINANVELFEYSIEATDNLGKLLASGSSSDNAGFSLEFSSTASYADPLILKVMATAVTEELYTHNIPVLKEMWGVVNLSADTQSSDNQGTDNQRTETLSAELYVTPLSTFITKLALVKQQSDGSSFETSLDWAEGTVSSVFLSAIEQEIDILSGSPVLLEAMSLEQKLAAWKMRTANEYFANIAQQIAIESGEDLIDIIEIFANDLLDGRLDATAFAEEVSQYDVEQLEQFQFLNDISQVFIPSSNTPFSLLHEVMINESALLQDGSQNNETFAESNFELGRQILVLDADIDGDGSLNVEDADDDGDGYSDYSDVFPYDSSEWKDTDGDLIGNNEDIDDDNDGVEDYLDPFPEDASETLDNDNDGIGNNADPDDDNDDVEDISDAFPLDTTEWKDTDGDGIGNNADLDDDNDSVEDSLDMFPEDASESVDTDADGIGNNSDTDDDNDSVEDTSDAFPLDSSEWLDFDGDNIGDNADPDNDNDGVMDELDRIEVSGAKNTYLAGEMVQLKVRGTLDDTALSSIGGWHVQYFSYFADQTNDRVDSYVENGYFNAAFNSRTLEWEINFPMVEYDGEFEMQISLYCSRSSGICDGSSNYAQFKQSFNYVIECNSGDSCVFTPSPEPGINISANEGGSEFKSIHEGSNGDLYALYGVFESNTTWGELKVSKDTGQSWSLVTRHFRNTPGFVTTDGESLIVYNQCQTSGNAICINRQVDSTNWTSTQIADLSFSITCGSIEGCTYSPPSIHNVIKISTDSYLMVFTQYIGSDVNVYTMQSSDLQNWTAPREVPMSSNTYGAAQAAITSSGTVVLAVLDSRENKTQILTSEDLENWTVTDELSFSSSLSTNLSFTSHDDVLRLFYSEYGSLYFVEIDNAGEISSSSTQVDSGLSFGPKVIKSATGDYLEAYSLDLNGSRDVFFENLGQLDF